MCRCGFISLRRGVSHASVAEERDEEGPKNVAMNRAEDEKCGATDPAPFTIATLRLVGMS
jgi:hypothetical protein